MAKRPLVWWKHTGCEYLPSCEWICGEYSTNVLYRKVHVERERLCSCPVWAWCSSLYSCVRACVCWFLSLCFSSGKDDQPHRQEEQEQLRGSAATARSCFCVPAQDWPAKTLLWLKSLWPSKQGPSNRVGERQSLLHGDDIPLEELTVNDYSNDDEVSRSTCRALIEKKNSIYYFRVDTQHYYSISISLSNIIYLEHDPHVF